MEVQSAPALPATSTMDIDMDIDIDYGDDEPIAQTVETSTTFISTNDDQDGPAAYREDNLEPQLPCPNKVHIRGLDDLSHDDIKAYAREHYPSQDLSRIEWIDDTSANLSYPTDETGAEALESFTEQSHTTSESTQLRPAKSFSSRPFTSLFVRQANTHDVKKPGASESSRFYLLNPEYDPRERRRQYDGRRGRGGRDGRFKRRRSEPEPMPFDESMYDDPPVTQDAQAMRFEGGRRSKKPRYEGSSDDLFAGNGRRGAGGRLRDRSASPSRLRNGDGRFGFSDDENGPYNSSLSRALSKKNPNAGKELFGSPAASARSFLRESSPAARELFPAPRSPVRESNAGKELFDPNPPGTPYHRRTDAFDAADDVEDRLSRSPTMTMKPRSLEDRITGGPPIRGQSPDGRRNRQQKQANPGFAIKGAARETNARVKELFPDKVGDNSGKELFAGRLKSRQRAEDLFG